MSVGAVLSTSATFILAQPSIEAFSDESVVGEVGIKFQYAVDLFGLAR